MSGDRAATLDHLVRLRHRLHAQPECAGDEAATAETVATELADCRPTGLHRGVGGHGVAAEWRADAAGPTVLLRAELDALPLVESTEVDYRSQTSGAHHACGHDGHMAILVGVARRLAESPPARGRVVLLFQPAEETGEGAARVLADPAFADLRPDWAFALHNLPGFPLGQVLVREGCFAAGSAGLIVRLGGRTSHAAHPEQGRSPARAVARLVLALDELVDTSREGLALSTVIHARVGSRAFGTTPGDGEVLATVRTDDPERMRSLRRRAEAAAERVAAEDRLRVSYEWTEVFPTTLNHSDAAAVVRRAGAAAGLEVGDPGRPFRWSEDFGHLSRISRAALLGLGSGEDQPALHAPDYDFPDELIGPGVDTLDRCARIALEEEVDP